MKYHGQGGEAVNKDIFFFDPVMDERIWGGEYLKVLYGKTAVDYPVGEAWLISALPGKTSTIGNLPFKGARLDTFFSTYPEYFLFPKADKFPLLVKMIDANDKLSIQVHPDDKYASEHGKSLGKNECWYILEADPDSTLVIGHNASTRTELENLVHSGAYSRLVREIPIHKDDFVFIPSGTLHAIGKGVRLVEVQQPTDVTYRVYDYYRKDNKGGLRPLHTEAALDVITVPSQTVKVTNYAHTSGIVNLIKTSYFQVDKWNTTKQINYFNFRKQVFFFVVIEGTGKVNGYAVKKGDALMAAATNDNINVYGDIALLAVTLPKEVTG